MQPALGRYPLPIYRIRDVANRTFLPGVVGEYREVQRRLTEYLRETGRDRKDFRISNVQIEVGATKLDWPNDLIILLV